MIELKDLHQSDLVIKTDGGSRGNPGHAASGFVVFLGDQIVHEEGSYLGIKTNNDAEYSAFFSSVKWVVENLTPDQVRQIHWKLDSLLVVEQLNKKWKIKEPRMKDFAQEIWTVLANCKFTYKISHIPREENSIADGIVNQTLDAHIS
jgi:ribonuclease HI